MAPKSAFLEFWDKLVVMRNYSVAPSIAINISNLDEANLADGKNLPKKKFRQAIKSAGPKAIQIQ